MHVKAGHDGDPGGSAKRMGVEEGCQQGEPVLVTEAADLLFYNVK